jgi:hypothetical protein
MSEQHDYLPSVSATGIEICGHGSNVAAACGRLANHRVHRAPEPSWATMSDAMRIDRLQAELAARSTATASTLAAMENARLRAELAEATRLNWMSKRDSERAEAAEAQNDALQAELADRDDVALEEGRATYWRLQADRLRAELADERAHREVVAGHQVVNLDRALAAEATIDRLRAELAEVSVQRRDHHERRAIKAEDTINRVRRVIDETPSADLKHLRALVRAALDRNEK